LHTGRRRSRCAPPRAADRTLGKLRQAIEVRDVRPPRPQAPVRIPVWALDRARAREMLDMAPRWERLDLLAQYTATLACDAFTAALKGDGEVMAPSPLRSRLGRNSTG
jgi:hypothetical protein